MLSTVSIWNVSFTLSCKKTRFPHPKKVYAKLNTFCNKFPPLLLSIKQKKLGNILLPMLVANSGTVSVENCVTLYLWLQMSCKIIFPSKILLNFECGQFTFYTVQYTVDTNSVYTVYCIVYMTKSYFFTLYGGHLLLENSHAWRNSF